MKKIMLIFGTRPDYDLAVMKANQTLFDITVNVLQGIKEVLEKEKPSIVLVHGDTSTTFVSALACFYMQIPVGHVEAGLRTYNISSPYPEEFNRQAVEIWSCTKSVKKVTKSVEKRMRNLNHPSASLEAGITFNFHFFFSARTYMRYVFMADNCFSIPRNTCVKA
jgi:UDP-N-acetylglucosamine 2-epimerase